MIIALVDHNWRQQFSENIKALAAKKRKEKPVIEKGKSTTPPFIKKDKEKECCKHYGSACHVLNMPCQKILLLPDVGKLKIGRLRVVLGQRTTTTREPIPC